MFEDNNSNTLHEGLDGNYKLKGKTQQQICEE